MADIFKYEVAMGTAAQIGTILKTRQQELDRRIQQCRGAHEACLVLAKKLQEYQFVVRKEVEDADLDTEIHKRIARHVTNCALHAENHAAKQATQVEHLRGIIGGIDEALLVVDQLFKKEEAGMQNVLDAEEAERAKEPDDLLDEELPTPKTNGKNNEATTTDIRQLMSDHDKAGLIKLATKAGVSSQGSKAALAKRLLEQ